MDKKNEMSVTSVDVLMEAEEGAVNLSDFALFLSVMKNEEAHRNILSIITDNKNLKLKKVHVEEVVLNKSGKRAIRLDAWAVDTDDRYYATEMQNDTDQDDVRKRSRFYQGLLDTPILKSGRETRYRNLPSSIILSHRMISLAGTAQCTHLRSAARKCRTLVWMMEQKRFF